MAGVVVRLKRFTGKGVPPTDNLEIGEILYVHGELCVFNGKELQPIPDPEMVYIKRTLANQILDYLEGHGETRLSEILEEDLSSIKFRWNIK